VVIVYYFGLRPSYEFIKTTKFRNFILSPSSDERKPTLLGSSVDPLSNDEHQQSSGVFLNIVKRLIASKLTKCLFFGVVLPSNE
jgi:hypothetical protein